MIPGDLIKIGECLWCGNDIYAPRGSTEGVMDWACNAHCKAALKGYAEEMEALFKAHIGRHMTRGP